MKGTTHVDGCPGTTSGQEGERLELGHWQCPVHSFYFLSQLESLQRPKLSIEYNPY